MRNKKTDTPIPLAYFKDAPLVLYTTMAADTAYLRSLLISADLFDDGCPCIPHGQSTGAYIKILRGNFSGISANGVLGMDLMTRSSQRSMEVWLWRTWNPKKLLVLMRMRIMVRQMGCNKIAP